jgi:hypothetical protein
VSLQRSRLYYHCGVSSDEVETGVQLPNGLRGENISGKIMLIIVVWADRLVVFAMIWLGRVNNVSGNSVCKSCGEESNIDTISNMG